MFPSKDDVLYNAFEDKDFEAWKMKEGQMVMLMKGDLSFENLQRLKAIVKALMED